MVETTRGCPHQCDFCGVSRFFGHHYRKRPIEDVVAELRSLFGSGFRHRISRFLASRGLDLPYFIERRLVYFVDSNFAADRAYTSELMDELEQLDVLWWAHTTVDVARDEEYLQKMRASGCVALNIGFETLTAEHLSAMHKSFAGRFDYSEAIRRIHKNDIGVMGTFVVGFDGEDSGIFQRLNEFILENQLDWALAFIRTPYPGTLLFEQMEREGRILTRDWEKYDTLNCVFTPVGMTTEELEGGVRAMWKEVFSVKSIRARILSNPRVHPMFYFMMNMQFFQMVRRWQPQFNPFQQ